MKIYLVGITGAGKSTFGKFLAEKLQFEFIDLDERIVAKEQLEIDAIFKQKTEAYFRKLESQCLEETFLLDKVVIATGGGAPCFYDGIKKMNQHGITIWLNPPLPVVAKRLSENPNTSQRPMLDSSGLEGITSFLELKLNERIPYYSQSKLVLENPNPENEDISMITRIITPST